MPRSFSPVKRAGQLFSRGDKENMKRNQAIFSGSRFAAMVNVITTAEGQESFEVEKWGTVDAVPHAVPFPVQSWAFESLTEAVDFAKAVEVD
jgi:hypothetical protein